MGSGGRVWVSYWLRGFTAMAVVSPRFSPFTAMAVISPLAYCLAFVSLWRNDLWYWLRSWLSVCVLRPWPATFVLAFSSIFIGSCGASMVNSWFS